MQIVIDIPVKVKEAFDNANIADVDCYVNDYELLLGKAIKNGTPLKQETVREFEEIVIKYPPEDLCTYPEYKGKPYFSIKYKEGNDYIIGFGTYNPKVFSRYLRDYFMPSATPQEPKWISSSERLPDTDDEVLCWYEYYHWSQEKVLPEYGLGRYLRETSAWFGEVANGKDVRVIAWMPLPEPYKAESEK